jgi:predicted ribosomally synthesized peptide with SipW-like signal peptide
MKKILFILMAAAVCLSLLFTAFAYFDDTEESAGNSFQAGTWAVDVNNGGGNAAAHTFQGLAALDSGAETWSVKNTGTVSVYVDINITVSEDGTGNLGDHMTAHLFVVGGDSIYGSEAFPLAINDAGGGYPLNLPLGAGKSKNIALEWNVDAFYTPVEGDKVEVGLTFDIQPAP